MLDYMKENIYFTFTNLSSLSVTATKTGCHRSVSSELSELERPFYKVNNIIGISLIQLK